MEQGRAIIDMVVIGCDWNYRYWIIGSDITWRSFNRNVGNQLEFVNLAACRSPAPDPACPLARSTLLSLSFPLSLSDVCPSAIKPGTILADPPPVHPSPTISPWGKASRALHFSAVAGLPRVTITTTTTLTEKHRGGVRAVVRRGGQN